MAPDPDSPSSPSAPPSASATSLPRAGLALVVAAFGVLGASAWNRVSDPLVDFGTELYVPWRVFEGDVLYRDVVHHYAPLSTWVNVFWFHLLGPSRRSVMIGNALVFALILWMLDRILRRFASGVSRAAALLFVVTVFGFGQYTGVSNYNYLTPYAHELTHGLLLGLVAMDALLAALERRGGSAALVCGLATGLAFLTKYEVFIALAGAIVAGFAVRWRSAAGEDRRPFPWAALMAGLAAGPVLCWATLTFTLPARAALRATLGAWPLLLNRGVVSVPFYADSSGLSAAGSTFAKMGVWLAVYAGLALPLLLIARFAPRRPRGLEVVAAVIPGLAIVSGREFLSPHHALTAAPFALLALALASLAALARGRLTAVDAGRVALNVFGLLMLLKIPLAARAGHYGFVLAMPGTVFLIVTLVDRVPRWLKERSFDGAVFRNVALSSLGGLAVLHLLLSAMLMGDRTRPIGEGANRFYVDDRGQAVAEAVALVRARVPPGRTLATLPEGGLVNFLSGRRSSIPFPVMVPSIFSIYSEATMLAAMRAHPPDYILLFDRRLRDLSEYGCVTFGRDCATEIGAFMKAEYHPRAGVAYQGIMLVGLLERNGPGPVPGFEVIESAIDRRPPS